MKFSGIIVTLLLLFALTSYDSTSVYAQLSCDQCGFCVGGEPPADYDACVQCLYQGDVTNEPTSEKKWTVVGCVETTPGGFTQSTVRLITSVIGGIIFIVLLYGSFILLTSSGDVVKINKGKSLVRTGIVSLLLILFSIFILRFIGVTILNLPGFE